MRQPIVDTNKIVSDGSTPLDFTLNYKRPGEIICSQLISVANLTTGGTIATIGLKRGETVIWIETQTLTTIGAYYSFKPVVFFPSDHRLVVRFGSTVSGDELVVNSFGYAKD
jgi:hypothetical protein